MKTKTNKLMALLLTAILLVSALAGCASEKTETVETLNPVSTQAVEDTAEIEADPQEEINEAEETDDQFVYATWPLDETATFTVYQVWNTSMYSEIGLETPSNVKYYQYVEEKTNVHLEFQTQDPSTISEKFNLMVASGEYPDIFSRCRSYYTGGLVQAIEDDVFMDLAKLVSVYAPNYSALMEEDEEFKLYNYTDEGYLGQFMTYREEALVTNGPVIRQDWMDELGLEAPTTYGEWYNVLTAFKSAYEPASPYAISDGGIPTSGDYQVGDFYIDENDQVAVGWLNEADFKEYYTMYNKWYAEGLISTEIVLGQVAGPDFTSYSLTNDTGLFIGEIRDLTRESSVEGYEIQPISWPVRNDGDQWTATASSRFDDGFSISSTCWDPELCVQFCDFFWQEDMYYMGSYGIEGESFVFDENGAPQYTDVVLNNPDGLTFNQAVMQYVPAQVATYKISASEYVAYNDMQASCVELWAGADTSKSMPGYISMTTEESELYSGKYPDIETYAEEMCQKFIVGEADVEADYQTFVETLMGLGLQEIIDIYQTAYERAKSR